MTCTYATKQQIVTMQINKYIHCSQPITKASLLTSGCCLATNYIFNGILLAFYLSGLTYILFQGLFQYTECIPGSISILNSTVSNLVLLFHSEFILVIQNNFLICDDSSSFTCFLGSIKASFNCCCLQLFCSSEEQSSSFVTESTKTLLIAYRQVLRKASFNYSKCCSLPMAEAASIEFSHIIQQYITFKTILQPSRQETSFPPFQIVFLPRWAPRWYSSIRRAQQ